MGPPRSHVEEVIARRVADRAAEWFPEVGASPRVRVSTLSRRPRCALYVVHLSGAGTTGRVLAKVRRDPGVSTEPQAGRPRLAPGPPATVAELTALEFEGLQAIAGFVGMSHPDFGAVRALDHLPSESTLLMDFVDQRTLRQNCIGSSRLVPFSSGGAAPEVFSRSWQNAGAWLRSYHDAVSTVVAARPTRQASRQEVVDRFHTYGDFLDVRLGSRLGGEVAGRASSVASEVLPSRLPLVVGHGDYVMRNMFVDGDGRITVFDPMPRWRMPYLEDVCRFLVGLRLLGLQLRTHGAAYSRRELDRLEALFLSGYFGGDEPPMQLVRSYQLLVLLDKWSALLGAPSDKGRSAARLRRLAMLPANDYIVRQARRLLDTAERSTPAPLEDSP